MLLEKENIKAQFDKDKHKLDTLIDIKLNTPAEFNKNTAHFTNYSTLFPYIYHKVLVQKWIEEGAKILDWGAYLGQVSYLLQDEYDVTAYNPDQQPDITYWHEKLGIKNPVFGSGVEENKLDLDTKFDAVLSSGVLEHTFEFGVSDIDALKNLNGVLKDDGYLFIWHLPTQHALSEFIARRKKSWKHILRYDLDDILVKLNMTGFEIVEIEVNDLIFSKLTKVLSSRDITDVWELDYKLAHLPMLKALAHHFTIVAKKVSGFPKVPATSGYTTYV